MKHVDTRRTWAGATVAMVLLLSTPSVTAREFTQLVVFGGSNVDSGNVCPNATFCPSPPYAFGRFSNGPVWVEVLAERLGLPIEASDYGGMNFARGGATTDDMLALQLPAFLARTGGVADPRAIYVLSGGGNDLLAAASPIIAARRIGQLIRELSEAGARTIYVVDMGDAALVPALEGDPIGTLFAAVFNLVLAGEIRAFPDVTLIASETAVLLDDVVDDPAAYGLTNTLDPCFETGCSRPEEYLWWDRGHISAAANAILGDTAYRQVLRQTARLDLSPRSALNCIDPGRSGVVEVRLSAEDLLDVREVDVDSLRFGGARALRCEVTDDERGDDVSLACDFRVRAVAWPEAGSDCGPVHLRGELVDGARIGGQDSACLARETTCTARWAGLYEAWRKWLRIRAR